MRFVRRRDLGLSLAEDGAVVVRASAAGIGARVPPVAVGVLAYFSEPRDPDEAARAFGPQAGALVKGLIDVGLLVPEGEGEATPVFFENFSSLDVHRRMLEDKGRVEAYRRALDAVVRPGMRVMDAGTGSGVLAVLAARAGAGAVVAVDNSEMIEQARKVVDDSGLSEVIRCVRSDFAAVRTEPVDVVVTETFGAFALAEGAAEDLIRCCEANLAPGGVVIPSAVSLWLAPIRDPAAMEAIRGPWEVEGVALSALAAAQEHRAVTRLVDPAHVGEPQLLARVAFPHEAVRARGTIRIEGPIEGLCGWFDLHLAPGVDLPTGPSEVPTHWQQVVLPWRMDGGEGTEVAIEVEPAAGDRRGLEIRATWEDGGHSWRVR